MRPKKKYDRRKTKDENKSTDAASSSETDKVPEVTRSPLNVKNSQPQNDEAVAQSTGTCNKNDSSTEENAAEVDSQMVKKYAKRTVTSNWERYKELCDEDEECSQETPTAKGADFIALKDTGGIINSQFRFQDEKEWEENVNLESLNEFQSLNVEDLAFTLSCIPLHNRLNISADYFESSLINEFEDEARENQAKFYKQNMSHSVSGCKGTHNSPTLNNIKDVLAQVTDTEILKKKTQNPCEDLEDDLDALLNLSSREHDIPKGKKFSPLQPSALFETVILPATSSQPILKQELKKMDAEDWLDSLLED